MPRGGGASSPRGHMQIVMYDVAKQESRVISTNRDGKPSRRDSFGPSLSADGAVVAFYSWASDLVANDDNGILADVFIAVESSV